MIQGFDYDRFSTYTIRIKGQLDQSWSDWFCGLEIKPGENETVLSGRVPDQAALYGVLTRLGAMGFTLLFVERIGSTQEKDEGHYENLI